MPELQVIVVTPETTLLDQVCEFVVVPLIDGEAGVLPGHAPMIGRLGPGELRVRAGGKDQSYYVDGGFVQVDNDVISVLTNKSVPVAKLDLTAARAALAAAEAQPGNTSKQSDLKNRALAQAKAQIRLLEKA
jgi:F-type H+-transporting ATPase subunit epsilon